MKHIFSVHSPITFLAAYSTIKHLELDKEDVIILSNNYHVPISDYKVIKSFYEVRNKTPFQKLRYFNVPKAFDNYISIHLNGNKFIAYVDLMSYYQKILVTHTSCAEFHFIEEGNGTYQFQDDIDDITWIERRNGFRANFLDLKSIVRVLRGFNLRLLSLPYIYTAYSNMNSTKFYCLSNNAYYCVDQQKKILVKPQKGDRNISKLARDLSLKNQCIWLDGSNGRYTGLDESYYHDAIRKAIAILRKKKVIDKTVYVKLRPKEKDIEKNALVSILKAHNIKVEVLPRDMIIEAFLMQSENCNVIGVMTSVLEYAHVFGHKAYSIYGLFEKQPPTFFDRMIGFWENIENLKDS
jgi:hypothetical protein